MICASGVEFVKITSSFSEMFDVILGGDLNSLNGIFDC